ncbi:sensor histidine kinase [Pseudoalteromonas byunsanensis]|uniref:histidine kinase n=1 Tax=Pseudoalteromonas byunsanensis TaxID=327939 RepID=A0A1S1N4E5_9GAMM|nr:sensor histidine kinase [Pseudoalteromonas byunsanensis]OHU94291.1 histidine kinase [Pseudoalteromonas byunsanensis]
MKSRHIFLLLLNCFASFLVTADALELTPSQHEYELKKYALFFHDYNKQISSVKQLQSMPNLLEPYTIQKPNPEGYWKWAQIDITNHTNESTWYVSFGFARLPVLEMYWQSQSGEIISLNESSKFTDRPFKHPQLYIPIEISPKQSKTLYIKYQTFANAPANIRIHSPDHFTQTMQMSVLNNAIIVGIVLAILLIVTVNLFFNRNLTNVFYALWTSMFLFIVVDMAGFTYQYFWPEVGQFSNTFSIVLMVLVPILHILFVRSFLQLKYHHVALDKIYIGSLLVYTALVPVALWLQSVFYNLLASSLIIPIFLYTCYWCMKQQAPGIRIFAVSLFNHVLFVNVLAILGASFGNVFAQVDISTYIKVGYLIEVCLFTVAMAVQHKSVQYQLVYRLQKQVNSLNESMMQEQKISLQNTEQIKKNEQRLFTDLSHELRTPLTVMKIQVESLQHNIVDNVHDSYKKLQDKIDELNEFINTLMLVSDSKDLHYGLNIEPVKVGHFIKQVTHSCGQSIDSNQHCFSVRCELNGMSTISIDAKAIKQVIDEAISNALKFGGSTVQILLSFIETDNNLTVRIENSGDPLTFDAHQLLFEPLFRQEPSRNSASGGKGMGLAVCKKLIDAHQGEITSYNSSLGGVAIEFKLPKSFAYEFA